MNMQSESGRKVPPKKNVGKKNVRQATQAEINKEAVAIKIISSLNMLILQANAAGLGNAARILHNAKEDLAYWTVDMDFYESKQDQFINKCVYDSGVSVLIELLSKATDITNLDFSNLGDDDHTAA